MKNIQLEKTAKRKQEARDIAREVINFGITEDQKIDIMFHIAMTLESNNAMSQITKLLKKFRETINKEENTENNDNKSKILI